MQVLEMTLGPHIRIALSQEAPRYLALSGGGSLLRTHAPLPPSDSRLHVGGYAGLGLEAYVMGRVLVGVEGRTSYYGTGTTGVSLLLTVGSGSP